MDLTVNLSTGKIERAALKVLYDGLNDKIEAMEATWANADADFYESIGRQDPVFTIEKIEADNFYAGHVPSLIEAPIDRYPNCSTICYFGRPQQSPDDLGEIYHLVLRVEIMARSEREEEEVNARLERMLEAVHAVILADSDIGGTAMRIQGAPAQEKGDVFVRRQEAGMGPRWFWQGGALEYIVHKYVSFV